MHCNVLELRGLSGLDNVEDGLRWLAEMGVRLPVISDGERGLFSLYDGRIIRQPAFRMSVIDPSGAGDVLCAGILFKLSELLQRKRFECLSRVCSRTINVWASCWSRMRRGDRDHARRHI